MRDRSHGTVALSDSLALRRTGRIMMWAEDWLRYQQAAIRELTVAQFLRNVGEFEAEATATMDAAGDAALTEMMTSNFSAEGLPLDQARQYAAEEVGRYRAFRGEEHGGWPTDGSAAQVRAGVLASAIDIPDHLRGDVRVSVSLVADA